MTEDEWLACADPAAMLMFLRSKASDRKLRLFACACCRQYCYMLVAETLDALDVAEKFADGLVGPGERKLARERALNAGWCRDESTRHSRGPAKSCVANALARRSYEAAARVSHISQYLGVPHKTDRSNSASLVSGVRERSLDRDGSPKEQKALQTRMLHDLFDNLYYLVAIDPSWLTSTVVALARGIYDDRAFDRLPILADALQDAGCENADVLAHCRGEGPHVRGCWVVDLLLGKE